jgi:excisionase family DNA binding protein
MQFDKPRHKLLDAAKLLGISRARLYERISEGAITVVKDGRATFITSAEIMRYAKADQGPVQRFAKEKAAAAAATATPVKPTRVKRSRQEAAS